MDRLEAMSIVLAVAEAGSLSAAARQQKTPLATVSRKVSELEAHLRTKLFNRSSRALVPDRRRALLHRRRKTNPCRRGRSRTRRLRRVHDAARGAESCRRRSRLAVCICSRFWRSFWRRFRRSTFSSACRIGRSIFCEEHVDVALRIGALADSSLIAVRIGEILRVVCASPAYLKSRGTAEITRRPVRPRLHQLSAVPIANHLEI